MQRTIDNILIQTCIHFVTLPWPDDLQASLDNNYDCRTVPTKSSLLESLYSNLLKKHDRQYEHITGPFSHGGIFFY